MNTLSLHESSPIAREADSLCEAIRSKYPTLRAGELGHLERAGRTVLAGASFRLVQSDRNTIYRISGRFRWFLKMPRNGNEDVIRREILGAEAVVAALGDHAGYQHAAAIRASTDTPYLLCARVPGRTLNLAFYAACVVPVLGGVRLTHRAFHNFGEALGRLHRSPQDRQIPPATRDVVAKFHELIEQVSEPDSTIQAIQCWAKQNRPADPATALIHGNLKLENVLARHDRLCLIDFENCGCGSPYEDLSWACSQIALTRTLAVFPYRRGLRALSAFLEGYRGSHGYRADVLLDYVTMRICHYYVSQCYPQFKRPRIAGMPVRKPRLQRLVCGLLDGRHAAMFPGVEFQAV